MERVTTGVKGFDSLIEGGFPKGSTALVTGSPGTGKTIFALHFLCEGAAKGENGIYVVIDSGHGLGLSLLKEQAEQLGLPIAKYEQEGKIKFMAVPLESRKFNLFEDLKQLRKEMNAQRIVFDSITTFITNLDLFSIPIGYAGVVASSIEGTASNAQQAVDLGGKVAYESDPQKRFVYLAIEMLRGIGATNLIVSYGNSNEEGGQIASDGVSDFACDGIVALYNNLIGAKHIRTLSVIKMRDTKQSPYIHNFDITEEGIVVQPAEQVYK